LAIYWASARADSGVSARPTPNRINAPVPISPATRPSARTDARETRCRTARMIALQLDAIQMILGG